ncbi:MAG: DUF3309 domain-containing protein [Acidobacteriota bacterium]
MITIIVILLILMLLGAVPRWPHSKNWGYGPSGLLGVVLLVIIVLALVGRQGPNRRTIDSIHRRLA